MIVEFGDQENLVLISEGEEDNQNLFRWMAKARDAEHPLTTVKVRTIK